MTQALQMAIEAGERAGWIVHWINDLISQETIDNNTFEEWMWCPERYSSTDLMYMKSLWDKRRENKAE